MPTYTVTLDDLRSTEILADRFDIADGNLCFVTEEELVAAFAKNEWATVLQESEGS